MTKLYVLTANEITYQLPFSIPERTWLEDHWDRHCHGSHNPNSCCLDSSWSLSFPQVGTHSDHEGCGRCLAVACWSSCSRGLRCFQHQLRCCFHRYRHQSTDYPSNFACLEKIVSFIEVNDDAYCGHRSNLLLLEERPETHFAVRFWNNFSNKPIPL